MNVSLGSELEQKTAQREEFEQRVAEGLADAAAGAVIEGEEAFRQLREWAAERRISGYNLMPRQA